MLGLGEGESKKSEVYSRVWFSKGRREMGGKTRSVYTLGWTSFLCPFGLMWVLGLK